MWLMNEAEVKELVEKALDIDCIIYQQQLGLTWERPALPFMERCGPIRPQRQAQKTARQAASELLHSGKTSHSSLGTREASVGPGALVEASVGPGALVEAGAGPEARSSVLAVEGEREDSKGEVEKKESEVQGEVSVLTVKRLLELLCDETVRTWMFVLICATFFQLDHNKLTVFPIWLTSPLSLFTSFSPSLFLPPPPLPPPLHLPRAF